MSTTYVLGLVIAVAALLAQRLLLGNRAQWWLGALLPAAWVAFVVVLATQARITDWRGWLALAAGLFLLLGVWNEAHDAREKRLKDEDQRIDALNAHSS